MSSSNHARATHGSRFVTIPQHPGGKSGPSPRVRDDAEAIALPNLHYS